jgi:hypothetical protein
MKHGRSTTQIEFVGKEPLTLRAAASLLFASTVLMLTPDFGGKYFLPEHAPSIIS